ncbi:hypothetical protein BDFB_000153 [Asbolus verrucosus]|uniref:EGF-like domain-containing protein n=1 Tax=Asbolus verrucosus TaxID=1661398 RepID=A0A482VTP4_ASBVE|nr:hypothetical protein BDFB_000153 [Asbolus verrucosus]
MNLLKTLVYHHLADQILNVEMSEEILHVPVYQLSPAVLQTAGQNVASILNVQAIWLVSAKNAEILVQDLVELVHNLNLSQWIHVIHLRVVLILVVTMEFVFVYPNIKVTLIKAVDLNLLLLQIHVHRRLAVQTVNAEQSTIKLYALVFLVISELHQHVDPNALQVLNVHLTKHVCPSRQTGDPFTNCVPIPEPVVEDSKDPCRPSPCGPNSQCKDINGAPSCSCLPEFTGSPPNCRPECVSNSECANHLACINQKCKDPCPGLCGSNAECRVDMSEIRLRSASCLNLFPPILFCLVHHHRVVPMLFAKNETMQDRVRAYPIILVTLTKDADRTCVRNKCTDPCPGSCGQNAQCHVVNHLPRCTCIPGYTGDPFKYCSVPVEPSKPEEPINPCQPSPCGPNSQCREVNEQAVCSCLADYIGSPPNCRPECVVSSECPLTKACVNQKCVDPCPGTCGLNTRCEAINHSPICSCQSGYTGDPFTRCYPLPPPQYEPPQPTVIDPCAPSPCGPNSQCRDIGGTPSCSCLANFVGNPPNCRPECTINPECSSNLACIRQKCRDPCPGSCGAGARCDVINHTPICTCPEGYTGDPFSYCQLKPPEIEPPKPDPCNPSPCGPNAQCNNGICTCLPEYQGDPYRGCRPECVLSTDCPRDKACIRNKCQDPCPGTCGQNAECTVINHIPTCTCIQGYSGNAFVLCSPIPAPAPVNPCNPSPCGSNSQCREINGQAVCSCVPGFIGSPPSCRPECVTNSECSLNQACIQSSHILIMIEEPVVVPTNPCQPSPCGPNSQCRDVGESPSCSCLPEFIGTPPNCRPECVSNSECANHLACINQKCKDPCPGTCGQNAECRVVSHAPNCVCLSGFIGNPLVICTAQTTPPNVVRPTPCLPSPCGINAICREQNGAGACICQPEHVGNPYEGCRPECVLNSDCPSNKACVNQKCKDPCPGTCGQNAQCQVINHLPTCTCIPGYTGDPFTYCNLPQQPAVTEEPTNPCQPSPCGPNSQCREVNEQAVCSCLPNYIGSPPGCRPECVVSSECPLTKACINQKCVDPCPGTCGLNARCQVINHSPICSCQSSYTGDPFTRCYPLPPPIPEPSPPVPLNPCVPSPCGANSQCRDVGGTPSCSCLTNYIGSPPNCRPECTINPECSSNLACIREKCRDPCPGSCGANARCEVINHTPVCICPDGFTGDPFTNCYPKPPEDKPVPQDLCNPSPCGANAQCDNGELAESMLDAKLSIITQYAVVRQVKLEIHFIGVYLLQNQQLQLIHVNLHLAGQIRNVEKLEAPRLAPVYQNLQEHHPTVDLNVSVTVNVQVIWLVSIKNAKILALEAVALMPNAE